MLSPSHLCCDCLADNIPRRQFAGRAGVEFNVAPGSGHTVWLPLPASSVGAFVARYVNLQADVPEAAVNRGHLCAKGRFAHAWQ